MRLSDPRVPYFETIGQKVREILERETEPIRNNKARLPVYQLHRRYLYLTGDEITLNEFGRALSFACPSLSVQRKTHKKSGKMCQCILRRDWMQEYDPDINVLQELY